MTATLGDINLFSGGGIRMDSSGIPGIGLIDLEATGTGNGIQLNSSNNPVSINANRGISLSNSTANPIIIINDASTNEGFPIGIAIADFTPPGSGGIQMYSPGNSVGIYSGVGDFVTNTGGNTSITSGNTILLTNLGNSLVGVPSSYAPLMIYDQSPPNTTNGRGVTIRSDSNAVSVYAGGLDGIRMVDAEPTGTGAGLGLVSLNNNLSLGASNGSIYISSQNNDVNIVSSNTGAGGVNVSAIGGSNANIRLITNGSNTGVIISNIFTGGSGTLIVNAGSQLYWNGSFTVGNGLRPLYAEVTGTSLTPSTSPAITNTNYGTYFNITNSGFNTLTLPTSTYSTDSNAFWVLRNNTSSYLSITTTYTGTGGGGSASLVIPPTNSTTIMFTSNTSGSNAYTFF
jgi:hypothetical protein